MKKFLLLNVILFQVVILFGQSSFQLFDGEGNEVVNGQNIEVLVTDLEAFQTVSDEYFVKNVSSLEVSTQMRVAAVSMVDSTNFAFCFGACYPPGFNQTTKAVNIPANTLVGNEAVFTGEYYPDGHEGTSVVRYTYYNENNLNDTLSFSITFNGSVAAESSFQLFDVEGNEVINGENIEVIVTDLAAFETVSEEYFVMNNSDIAVDAMMRMQAVSLVDSAEFSFCALGSCFPAGVTETTRPMNIAAGETVGDAGVFTGHYHPHGHPGSSVIEYTFYNNDQLTDTLSFTITFNGGGNAVSELDADAVMSAYPNPASQFVNIQYNLRKISDGDLVVYNALGTVVLRQYISASQGVVSLDVSSLPRGIYLYRIEGEKAFSITNRIVLK